jgi:hypothetical protein
MGKFIEAFTDFFEIVEQNPLAVFALIIVVLSIIAFAFYRGGHEKIRSAGLLAVIMVSVALVLAFLPLTPKEPAQDPKPATERKPDCSKRPLRRKINEACRSEVLLEREVPGHGRRQPKKRDQWEDTSYPGQRSGFLESVLER